VKADSEIQQDVVRELAWDPRVDAADVGVTVRAGVVTLSGTVRDYAMRHAAQQAAHRVLGVLDVANDLRVKLPGEMIRTDADIAEAVRHALVWDVLVPHQRIHSTVADGRVTLEGTVEHGHERESAERAVRNLIGVQGVTNLITVAPPPVKPADVQHEIEAALARRAERAAKRVHVTLSGGKAVLEGAVASWGEREAILDAARATPGVREVESQLRITAAA
jgi:osmotically-inducible protein OsmY